MLRQLNIGAARSSRSNTDGYVGLQNSVGTIGYLLEMGHVPGVMCLPVRAFRARIRVLRGIVEALNDWVSSCHVCECIIR